MWADIKIKKKIELVGFFGTLPSKLAGSLIKHVVPLDQNVLAPSAIMASSYAIDDACMRCY